MPNTLSRWFKTLNYPSYIIFFVTARCNANCKMCFYKENMSSASGQEQELTVGEFEKIAMNIKSINILGISGGEPFLRNDLADIIKVIYKHCSPLVVDLPTNGYFTEGVIRQVEAIAGYCRDMVVDVQLSIDGPEKIHNQIRGLKDGFRRMKETYGGLVALRKRFKNLRVKACVVYSHYNKDNIEELFGLLERDFSEFDRVVFSVAHGSVSNPEVFNFDWQHYFALCDKIRKSATVKKITDLHSIFTIALRMAKNDLLKQVLKKKDMYRICQAGKKVIVINETGKVFPCEPLWHCVGELRHNDYDLNRILSSNGMRDFLHKMRSDRCNCHWGLPLSNALIYKPAYYPRIISDMLKTAARSAGKKGIDGYKA